MTFSDDIVQAVWEKARGIPDTDTVEWRQDQCGAWLHREQYNNADSEYGWKILRIVPGHDEKMDHLRPFHYRNQYDIALGLHLTLWLAERTGLPSGQFVNPPHNTTT